MQVCVVDKMLCDLFGQLLESWDTSETDLSTNTDIKQQEVGQLPKVSKAQSFLNWFNLPVHHLVLDCLAKKAAPQFFDHLRIYSYCYCSYNFEMVENLGSCESLPQKHFVRYVLSFLSYSLFSNFLKVHRKSTRIFSFSNKCMILECSVT